MADRDRLTGSPGTGPMRRSLTALLALALAAGAVLAGVLFFSARDDAALTAVPGPGRALADRGSRHLPPSRRGSVRYDTELPVSGPHVPDRVARDATTLTDDQVLHALELGNVVIVYPGAGPPRELRDLADAVAGRFSPTLAASGQAVILGRRPGLRGVAALAWSRDLRVASPSDPRLRDFAEAWLGRGDPDRRGGS